MILDWFRNWRDRRDTLRDIRRIQRDKKYLDDIEFDGAIESLRTAILLQDFRLANEIWGRLQREFARELDRLPQVVDFLLGMRRYDEADQKAKDRFARSPKSIECAEEYATIPMMRGDPKESLRRWDEIRKTHESELAYSRAAGCLVQLGRVDDADELLLAGTLKFPESSYMAGECAQLALHRKDWVNAESRWRLLRDRFNVANGWEGLGRALRGLARHTEEEALWLEAIEKFPLQPIFRIEYAFEARARGDLEEEIKRWAATQRRFPQQIQAYLMPAESLAAAGRIEEAEALLRLATIRMEREIEPYLRLDKLKGELGDTEGQLAVWAAARDRLPQRREGYERAIRILEAIGRADEATSITSEMSLNLRD